MKPFYGVDDLVAMDGSIASDIVNCKLPGITCVEIAAWKFIDCQHKLHWIVRGLIDSSPSLIVNEEINVGRCPFESVNMKFGHINN